MAAVRDPGRRRLVHHDADDLAPGDRRHLVVHVVRDLDRRRRPAAAQHDRSARPGSGRVHRPVLAVGRRRARHLVPHRRLRCRSDAARPRRWRCRSGAPAAHPSAIRFGAGDLTSTRPRPAIWSTGASRAASAPRARQRASSSSRTPPTGCRGSTGSRWDVGVDRRGAAGPPRRGRRESATLDLRKTRVRSLELQTGASETRVRLPRSAGVTTSAPGRAPRRSRSRSRPASLRGSATGWCSGAPRSTRPGSRGSATATSRWTTAPPRTASTSGCRAAWAP